MKYVYVPLSFLSSGMVLSNGGVVFIVECSVLLDVLSNRSFNGIVLCCSGVVKEANTSLDINLFDGNVVYNEVCELGSAAEITEIPSEVWRTDFDDTISDEYSICVEVTDCKGFDETIIEELTKTCRWEWLFVVKSSSEASKLILLLAAMVIEEAIKFELMWVCLVVCLSVYDDVISDNWPIVVVGCKVDKDTSDVRHLVGSRSDSRDNFDVVDSVE